MEVLRAGAHRRMPWKNGHGETLEIAASPAGASLDDFAWRISMARVTAAGPFSRFPGVDRTLVVLDGAGLVLDVAGREVQLGHGVPFSFDGDAATSARLVAGPIVDLNTMTRRGHWRHIVRRVREPVDLTGLVVVLARGPVRVDGVELERDDAAVGATRITEVTDAFAIELIPAVGRIGV